MKTVRDPAIHADNILIKKLVIKFLNAIQEVGHNYKFLMNKLFSVNKRLKNAYEELRIRSDVVYEKNIEISELKKSAKNKEIHNKLIK